MNGFLYVANKLKFIEEILISVKSLKRYNEEPICLVCTKELCTSDVLDIFDEVIIDDSLNHYTYLAKIVGMQKTPFSQTVFLDSDTFITDSISELFEILNLVDFATTLESKRHSYKNRIVSYSNIFPEFNTGVMVFGNSPSMKKLLSDWLIYCETKKMIIDMPGFREVVLLNFQSIRFSILPNCYNEHGFASMLQLDQKVKIIHERIAYKKGVITPHFADFQTMDAFAQKINKFHYKRFYIPKIGVISYRWSPINILLYIKKRMGYKRVSKNR
jgi:alpha-N-acetylglucosamine transferase